MTFGADYYERGEETGLSCYTAYSWRPELTIPGTLSIIRHLDIKKSDIIMDFGCAKGFVVKAFRQLGYTAFGCDISDYARNCDGEIKDYLWASWPGALGFKTFDVIIAKDVLEHLSEKDAASALSSFAGTKLLVIVPLGDGHRYVIPEMEKDVTHQIRQPLRWWETKIRSAGFKHVKSSHSLSGCKDNWVSRYPKGNGFFIAE
jgi:SAM-dependent methyltransferase